MASTYVNGIEVGRPIGGGRAWPRVFSFLVAILNGIGALALIWYLSAGYADLGAAPGGELAVWGGDECGSFMVEVRGGPCLEWLNATLTDAHGRDTTYTIPLEAFGFRRTLDLTTAVTTVTLQSNLGNVTQAVWIPKDGFDEIQIFGDPYRPQTDNEPLPGPTLFRAMWAFVTAAVASALLFSVIRWGTGERLRWVRWTLRLLIGAVLLNLAGMLVIPSPNTSPILLIIGGLLQVLLFVGVGGWIQFQEALERISPQGPWVVRTERVTNVG